MTNDEIICELLRSNEALLDFLIRKPEVCIRLLRAAAWGPFALDDADKDRLAEAAERFREELDISASWSGDRDVAVARLAREEYESALADTEEDSQ